MGAKKLQEELEDKYQVKIGYATVHLGLDKAAEHIYGTQEESFGYLFNFKAEIELRMPGSIVEIVHLGLNSHILTSYFVLTVIFVAPE